jgi:hypothetical protein
MSTSTKTTRITAERLRVRLKAYGITADPAATPRFSPSAPGYPPPLAERLA